MNNEFYTSIDRYGNNILYRGYASDSRPICKKVKFKPKLFVPDKDSKYDWKTMSGESVKPIIFDSMREMKDFTNAYSDVHDFKFYSFDKHTIAFIQQKFPDTIDYDSRLINVVTIDIETAIGQGFPDPAVAAEEIRSIAAHSTRDDSYHVWGTKPDYTPSKPNINYYYCPTEIHLLEQFIDWWKRPYFTPDILTGWNTETFDIPYIINRIVRTIGEDYAKQLSPWGLISKRHIKNFGRDTEVWDITGIQALDYMALFKKFGYTYGNQESYSLNHIAHVVLGKAKIDYSDVGSLNDLWEQDYQKFIDYNIEDVDLVVEFDKTLGFINIVFTLAYLAGVNFTDTLKTTPVWDAIIFRRLTQQNIAVPGSSGHFAAKFAGGYVKVPQVGMFDWILSFDLNSLYPNIIVQHNMSPETVYSTIDSSVDSEKMVDGTFVNTEKNTAIAANGAKFKTDKIGIIPLIVREMYDSRVKLKQKMIAGQQRLEVLDDNDPSRSKVLNDIEIYKNQQMAFKIALNSLYGAIGNAYFRYFDLKIAEGVTLTGQAIIKYSERIINSTLNNFLKTDDIDYVIAMDTDSCYVNVSDVVKKYSPNNPVDFLDKLSKKLIEPKLAEAFDDLAARHGAFENRMEMGREVIADRGIWTAKKRYVLNVLDNEGVRFAKPKIKMMGIEAVKSSTPQVCRDEMKRMFPIIMSQDEKTVQSNIAEFKKHFLKLAPNQVAQPRGANAIDKYVEGPGWKKSTPIHVRGAIIYNNLLKKKNLDKRFRLIYSGDKLKYIYLKTPNPIQQNVIAFPDDHLPDEFGLNKFIDFEKQFQKTYIDPLQSILTAVGWNCEYKASLQDFFC